MCAAARIDSCELVTVATTMLRGRKKLNDRYLNSAKNGNLLAIEASQSGPGDVGEVVR